MFHLGVFVDPLQDSLGFTTYCNQGLLSTVENKIVSRQDKAEDY